MTDYVLTGGEAVLAALAAQRPDLQLKNAGNIILRNGESLQDASLCLPWMGLDPGMMVDCN